MVLKDGSAQTDGNWTDMAAEKLRMEKKRKRRAASAKEGREGRHTVETVETCRDGGGEITLWNGQKVGTSGSTYEYNIYLSIYLSIYLDKL